MNTRQLQHFLAVLEHGSLAAAAANLAISQPALSKSVAALEDRLGQQLFLRQARGVRPTAAAIAFERHARRILQDLRAAEAEVALVGAGGAGRIAIGAGAMFLPATGAAILELIEDTDAEFDVMTDHAANLRSALLANRIDLYVGMCNHLQGDPAFEIDEVFRDAFTGVCLPTHPLAGRRVTAAECAGYEWVVPQLEDIVRGALEAFFVGQGLRRPRFRVATNADPIMAACLRDERMVSIAPRAAVGRGWLAGLAAFDLVGFSGERRVGLVRRASALPDPLRDRFASVLRRHVYATRPHGQSQEPA